MTPSNLLGGLWDAVRAFCWAGAMAMVMSGATYGRQVLVATGIPLQVSADGAAEWKTGGITLDWGSINAVTEETTFADGTVVPDGAKALALGTVLVKDTSSGKYIPWASGDLVRGQTFILNETVLQLNTNPLVGLPTDHPAVLEGGRVWKDRLLVDDEGLPDLSDVLAAMPRLRLVSNDDAEED